MTPQRGMVKGSEFIQVLLVDLSTSVEKSLHHQHSVTVKRHTCPLRSSLRLILSVSGGVVKRSHLV